MKLIMDATTGTVLNVENCYVVDVEDLDESDSKILDEANDSEVATIAKKYGLPIVVWGHDTGWGDNQYRYTVSYSPLSIMDEARSLIDAGMYDENEDEYAILSWVINDATQEDLKEVTDWIMNYDSVWDGYKNNVLEGIRDFQAHRKS